VLCTYVWRGPDPWTVATCCYDRFGCFPADLGAPEAFRADAFADLAARPPVDLVACPAARAELAVAVPADRAPVEPVDPAFTGALAT